MEENQDINQKDSEKRNEVFENLKKFLGSDMKIKEMLLKLAPTEMDDSTEKGRMQYCDKLYKALKDLEVEFISMFQNIAGGNQDIIKKIKTHFKQAKEAFNLKEYDYGVIKKLYKDQFSNMSTKLVEEVKSEFVGYTIFRGNLGQMIGKSRSVNELLHVMHSYVLNNDGLLKSLPIIGTKKNSKNYPITLYGEETELSRKLFDGIPEDLDVGWTEIVSMQNKILMMVRDRGHALTIDIDTTNEYEIAVKYFIPKICNLEMIKVLPGINISSITDNGATGLFTTTKEGMTNTVVNFIEKVPTDLDTPPRTVDKEENRVSDSTEQNGENIENESEPIFSEEDAKELAMETNKQGCRIGVIRHLRGALAKAKNKLNNIIFKGENNNDDRGDRD